MRIGIVTFDGFNELDSFVALPLLNRVPGWRAELLAPTERVTSMNGVVIDGIQSIDNAHEYDAILIGSGVRTRVVAADASLMARLALDPARQIIGAQCSGALILAAKGVMVGIPACTDMTSRPFVEAAGVTVIDAPFHAQGNVATAGGCMAASYLAAWVIAQGAGVEAARAVIDYVAPVGEKAATVDRVMAIISPFLPNRGCQ